MSFECALPLVLRSLLFGASGVVSGFLVRRGDGNGTGGTLCGFLDISSFCSVNPMLLTLWCVGNTRGCSRSMKKSSVLGGVELVCV